MMIGGERQVFAGDSDDFIVLKINVFFFFISLENNSREKFLKDLSTTNFKIWNDALLSKDPAEVAKLYTDNTSFLPTLNPELKKDADGAKDYFKHFLEKNPSGKIIEEVSQETSADSAGNPTGYLHSGLYDFEIGEPDNRKTVEARFTFLWMKNKMGEWKIAHHHSSLKPAE